ncbi:hypothetical protein K461DRAFT_89828 [Myriangium duriaei CBS 260.36]|uniref:Uncharacterized protein n=1 Tax=Myriangium duriaei CBS 260.36 TaxID=1168546 RepID=A0A9P4JC30_9PEZI|nr:hypothetical protein K461DRAFT_89828 [Myriangium duriaei CBS 260.36]
MRLCPSFNLDLVHPIHSRLSAILCNLVRSFCSTRCSAGIMRAPGHESRPSDTGLLQGRTVGGHYISPSRALGIPGHELQLSIVEGIPRSDCLSTPRELRGEGKGVSRLPRAFHNLRSKSKAHQIHSYLLESPLLGVATLSIQTKHQNAIHHQCRPPLRPGRCQRLPHRRGRRGQSPLHYIHHSAPHPHRHRGRIHRHRDRQRQLPRLPAALHQPLRPRGAGHLCS